jgi:hypothetical protein
VLEELELLLQLLERLLQQVAGLVATGLVLLPPRGEGRLALFTELAAREEMFREQSITCLPVVEVLDPAELVAQ